MSDSRQRLFWTFTSQGISSITNAGVAVLVGQLGDTEAFGAFAVALVVFMFTIGVVRAVVTDPLLIHHSASGGRRLLRASRSCAGASAAVGLALVPLTAVAALVAGWESPLGRALFAVGLCLPFLLVQDAWRHAFFAAGTPRSAAVNDAVWALVQFGLAAALLSSGRATLFTVVLCWGAGAVAGSALGAWQLGAAPVLSGALPWIRRNRELGARLGLDYVVGMGAYYGSTFVVGATAGLAANAALRAPQTLLGPLQTLNGAVTSFTLPAMSRRYAATGARSLITPALGLSAATGGIALVWVVVLLLLPTSAGEALFTESWAGAREVLLPSGLVSIAVGLSMGAAMALKGMARVDLLLRTTWVQSPLLVLGGVVGALHSGALGAAWGFVGAQAVGLLVMWVSLLRSVRGPSAAGGARALGGALGGGLGGGAGRGGSGGAAAPVASATPVVADASVLGEDDRPRTRQDDGALAGGPVPVSGAG